MDGGFNPTRRRFLKTLAGAPAALLAPARGSAEREIPRRILGKTGLSVTMLGFGAAWLGLYKRDEPALELGRAALDLGINFFDTARDYGASEERLGKVLEGRRKDVILMTKFLGRTRAAAEEELHTSLRTLRTDYLDVWQVHSLKVSREIDMVFAPDGGMEAAVAAQKAGKVRFIGVTGHKDPEVNLRALSFYDFDTMQLPLNVVDPFYLSFEKMVLPELVKRRTGVLAMKSMAGGWIMQRAVARPREALPYVWSLPVHVLISGVETVEQLQENARLAQEFKPLSDREKAALLARVQSRAGVATEYYKKKPDGTL